MLLYDIQHSKQGTTKFKISHIKNKIWIDLT